MAYNTKTVHFKKVVLLILFLLVSCTPVVPTSTSIETASSSPAPLPEATIGDMGVLGKGSAMDVIWSPDGALLAVGSTAGGYIYDTKTWEMVDSVPTSALDYKTINNLTFSPTDNHLIFPSGYPSSFWEYGLDGEQPIPFLENVPHASESRLVFSPDGAFFSFLNKVCIETQNNQNDCNTSMELRATDTGDLIHRFSNEEYETDVMAFNPDSQYIAFTTLDSRISVWNTADGKFLFEGWHDGDVSSISFSPDGGVLVSSSVDGSVRFWDAQTGKNMYTMRGFKQTIEFVAFIDDGTKLIIGLSYDYSFQEYALNDRHLPTEPLDIAFQLEEPVRTQGGYTPEVKMRLSPDTKKMAVLINDKVQIWDLLTGAQILSLPEFNMPNIIIEFSPDGNLLATADQNLHLWQVSPRKFLFTLDVKGVQITDLTFRPNTNQLALVTYTGDVQVWDIQTRKKVREFPRHFNAQVAYSSDGSQLALADGDKIQIRDADTGNVRKAISSSSGQAIEFAFSADGSQLYAVGWNWRAAWDIQTGKQVYLHKLPNDSYLGNVSIAPNLLVATSWTKPLYFYDPVSGEHLYDFHSGDGDNAVALSPDGRLLAWGWYYQTNLVDSASGELLATLDSSNVADFKFSGDGRWLAASSYNGTVQLWDVSGALSRADAMPLQTATPDLAILPTVTPTSTPIPQILLPSNTPGTPESGAILPENMDQLELLAEKGLGRAYAAAWSFDGEILAVGGDPGVYLFEAGASQPSRFLPAEGTILVTTFSPNGRYLAGQYGNSAVQVWEVETGKTLYRLENIGCWNKGMFFSEDEQQLTAYCGWEVYHWRMSDGTLIEKTSETYPAHHISPDGRMYIALGQDNAWLMDTGTGEIIRAFEVINMTPEYAAFSPDGKTLLIWYYRYEVARTGIYFPGGDLATVMQIWNIIPGEIPTPRATLSTGEWRLGWAEFEEFQNLAFTSDSRRLVLSSGDGNVQVWDVNSGRLLQEFPGGPRVYLSPDDRRVFSMGDTMQVWNISPGSRPQSQWTHQGFSGYSSFLAFAETGNELITASNGLFQVWDLSGEDYTQTSRQIEAPGVIVSNMAASPNGEYLAYSTTSKLFLGDADTENPNWHSLTTFVGPSIPGPLENGAYALAFSPDSSLLAVADSDRSVRLWHVDRLESIDLASEVSLFRLVFSPDGKLLLGSSNYSSEESNLYLWDTETGDLLRTWKAVASEAAFLPDNVTLIGMNYKTGVIMFYDLPSGEMIRQIQGAPYMRKMAVSPDGSLLAITYEDKMEFRDARSGDLLREVEEQVNQIAFSTDGTQLAVTLWDGRIQVWGLKTKQK